VTTARDIIAAAIAEHDGYLRRPAGFYIRAAFLVLVHCAGLALILWAVSC